MPLGSTEKNLIWTEVTLSDGIINYGCLIGYLVYEPAERHGIKRAVRRSIMRIAPTE